MNDSDLKFLRLVQRFIRNRRLGIAIIPDVYINNLLGDFFWPTVLFFYKGRKGKLTYKEELKIVPDVVMEVVRDSFDATSSRIIRYLGLGVKRVVIIDAETQSMHVYGCDGAASVKVFGNGQKFELPDFLPGFSVVLHRG